MAGEAAAKDPYGGLTLGRYRLRRMLVQGGMASVHLAQLMGPLGVERWVAVKIIHPHLASDRRFVDMFLDEARLSSAIRHPNVCSMLDFGEHEGLLYLVMEYLHGESLWSMLRGAPRTDPLDYPLLARVVADAARGLHAAHGAVAADGHALGIVHRDVSPQNIMVLYDGFTKVVDFGVARARGRLTRTSTGEVKGKFDYMSPEQLTGKHVDARTDVWALGVILWEATVGRRLFRGSGEGETTLNVMRMPIPRPRSLVPNYPAALERAVMSTLVRDRSRRTATAADSRGWPRALHPLDGPKKRSGAGRDLDGLGVRGTKAHS